jgi:hypothetical protein
MQSVQGIKAKIIKGEENRYVKSNLDANVLVS